MNRFAQLPLWAVLPVVFVLVGGAYAASMLVVEGGTSRSVLVALVSAVFPAGVVTALVGVVTARARRRAGGAAALVGMRRSVRRGEVPSDADPAVWIPVLEEWQRQLRQTRWLAPVLVAVMASACIWLATTADPVWYVFLAVFGVVITVAVAASRRALRDLDLVLAELRRRALPGDR